MTASKRNPTMSASVVMATVAYAVARGIPMERITEATGLLLTDLIDPDVRLAEHHVPTIWRLLQDAFPSEPITLGMAEAAPQSFFGPVAYAVRYAPDVRAAILVFLRYRRVLSSGLHMALHDEVPYAAFEFSHVMDGEDGGLGAEAGVAVGARFYRELTDEHSHPVRVEFAHRPNGALEAYEAFFRSPVRFRCGRNALVFRQETLSRPLVHADPQRFMYIQGHLDAVRRQVVGRPSVDGLESVREAIAVNAQRCEYGVEAIAKRLGVSVRSLQRQVASSGTTLRRLIDEVREANARRLLTEENLSVDEVGFLLGYSSEGAFRRAFTRWTGHSPAQLRRQSA